jgi:hypothetical protein
VGGERLIGREEEGISCAANGEEGAKGEGTEVNSDSVTFCSRDVRN